MAEQTDWTQLMIWLSICGFFRGAALSNFTLTVSEYCSLEKLPAAFGWHMIGKAIFVVMFGPLIGTLSKRLLKTFNKNFPYFLGLIRDVTGSYPLCIHSQSICIFICCAAWIIEYIVLKLRAKKPETT